MTLLPEYRAQLYGAAQRRSRRSVPKLARSWPVAASTLLVVGIAVAAVATLSHHHRSTPPAGPASPERQLLDTLGVLRRPQTKADLSAFLPGFLRVSSSRACRGANSERLPCTLKVDRPLIRTVAVPNSHYEVGIFPVIVRSVTTRAETIRGVAATVNGPGIYRRATGPWGLVAVRTRGLIFSAYVSDGVNRGVFVVPDGIARVVIGPVHLLDRKVTSRFTPTAGASAAVHDNVALFELTGLTMKNLQLNRSRLGGFFSEGSGRGCRINFAVYALPATAIVTWFGPNGHLVNHVRLNFPVYVGTHQPAPGTTLRNPSCASSR